MAGLIDNLRQKPEPYRHRLAFFSASLISIAIVAGWAFVEGYIRMPTGTLSYDQSTGVKNEPTESIGAGAASPLSNSASALKAAFDQFSGQINLLKETAANVLVPFMSGIEVYESK